jgi:hypothetical protein
VAGSETTVFLKDRLGFDIYSSKILTFREKSVLPICLKFSSRTSVSDPDPNPHWIRIRWSPGSGFANADPDPDPLCECGSGSRRVKSAPIKKKIYGMSEDQKKNLYFLCNHILGKEFGLKLLNVRKIRW